MGDGAHQGLVHRTYAHAVLQQPFGYLQRGEAGADKPISRSGSAGKAALLAALQAKCRVKIMIVSSN